MFSSVFSTAKMSKTCASAGDFKNEKKSAETNPLHFAFSQKVHGILPVAV